MKLVLTRLKDSGKSTLGVLKIECDDNFMLYTLELPYKDNEKRISCIPCGEYPLSYRSADQSGKYKYDHILVEDVPNRSYILFHVANYPKDILGCIGTGLTQAEDFIGKSRQAHDKLMNRILPELKEGKVKLEIRNYV